MKMAEFKELARLPKWAKIFLSVLSAVAVAALIGTFALMSWADDKVEKANLSFNGIDRGNTSAKADENAYKARVHFERLDFLLRSKVIAYIDITNISWDSAIKADAIKNLQSQNRHLKFTTLQNLQALNIDNLGTMSYKMDFSPLVKTILIYYLAIVFLTSILYVIIFFYAKQQSSSTTGGGGANFAETTLPHKFHFLPAFISFYSHSTLSFQRKAMI